MGDAQAEAAANPRRLGVGRFVALSVLALMSLPVWAFVEIIVIQEVLDNSYDPGDSRFLMALAVLGLATGFLAHRTFNNLAFPLVLMVLASLGSCTLIPSFVRARGPGQLVGCKSNLKNLGTALEMYSTDFEGSYPPSLQMLTPEYLKTLPTCPSAGQVTYAYAAESAKAKEAYTVVCSGLNHERGGVGAPDFPQYTSVMGLIERP